MTAYRILSAAVRSSRCIMSIGMRIQDFPILITPHRTFVLVCSGTTSENISEYSIIVIGHFVLSDRTFCPLCAVILSYLCYTPGRLAAAPESLLRWQPPGLAQSMAQNAVSIDGCHCPGGTLVQGPGGALLPPDPPYSPFPAGEGAFPQATGWAPGESHRDPSGAGLLKRMLSVCQCGKCQKMSIKFAKHIFGAEKTPVHIVLSPCEL